MMETIDDTGFAGIRIIQSREGFRYGIDAVLLADYVKTTMNARYQTGVELGSGNGIVSLLLAGRGFCCSMTGVEFQETAVEMAERSSEINGLSEKARFVCCDVACLEDRFPQMRASADLVVSNPPYIARGSGIPSNASGINAARQETTADLDVFIKTAAWLLRPRGHFVLVHRPSRLVDIMAGCRENRLEPKRIRFVHPRKESPPNILLLQCVLDGGKELKYDDPLYVYDADGGYSSRIMEIYGRG